MQTLLLTPLKIIIVLRPEPSSSLWAQRKTDRTCEVPVAADAQTCSLLLTETWVVRDNCS